MGHPTLHFQLTPRPTFQTREECSWPFTGRKSPFTEENLHIGISSSLLKWENRGINIYAERVHRQNYLKLGP